jgi:cytochrome d ubiquinol oxidase subunit I
VEQQAMPTPNLGPNPIHFPFFLPNGYTIGIVMEAHILLVAFIMGAAIIMTVSGSIPPHRQSKSWERFTKTFAWFLAETYSFGATLAVFGLVLMFGLYPRLMAIMASLFFAPLLAIFATWIIMTVSLIAYAYLWPKREGHRVMHQSLIYIYATAETAFIVLISMWTSYMLTPNGRNAVQAAFNATWGPETFHRIIGNVSYAGFLLAAWGGWRAFRKRRRGSSLDRAYYHWVAHFGFLWGIIFEMFQPLVGYLYVLRIQAGNPTTYYRMMLGDKSWAWLLQIALVGLTFVLSDLYMWLSIRRGTRERQGIEALTAMRVGAGVGAPSIDELRSRSTMKQVMQLGAQEGQPTRRDRLIRLYTTAGLWALGILTILGFIPASVPILGSMTTKYICLIGFVAFTLLTLFIYWRQSRQWTWGNMGAGAQWTLVSLGAVLMLIMIVMGGIRYSNPQTSVIEDTLPLPSIPIQQAP